jgi:hypothetical protein
MYHRDKRPLGGVAESAYEVLLEVTEPDEAIPRDEAHTHLLDADFADNDADYALDRLLSRGYLYAVDEELFVTDSDDYESWEKTAN